MIMALYIAFVLFVANIFETQSLAHPRLEFRVEDTTIRRIILPHRLINEHIKLLEDGNDRVIMSADQQLYSLEFNTEKPSTIHGERCEGPSRPHEGCDYNIIVLLKNKLKNEVFMCESSKMGTTCCYRKLPSAECLPSQSSQAMINMARAYQLQTGESALLIESPGSDILFVTQSSIDNSIGIYKLGPDPVRPTRQNNVEHQYLGLVTSRGSNQAQDKLYAFFKEKNNADAWETDLWRPIIAQVCMEDKGGIKNMLQYEWTTQLKARLFCGEKASQQHYPELVDVAFHPQEGGAVSRVYALFHNQWRMSAVCVYSIDDIKKVFDTSPFKGNTKEVPSPRPGTCTSQPVVDLKMLSFVQSHPEMTDRVMPMGGALLHNRHHYTHIQLHAVDQGQPDPHMVLYLSLESGKIHKVLESKTGAFIIAEYSLFTDRTHILDMVLQADERKLYVSTREEVIQVDVQGCSQYGVHCEDCVMARDPYCGWDGTGCVAATRTTLQDVEKGNYLICQKESNMNFRYQGQWPTLEVPSQSSHILDCPISSRHANYSWSFPSPPHSQACRSAEAQCTLRIDSMDPAKDGVYSCTAHERGYTRTLTQVQLQVKAGALAVASAPLAWACTVALVLGGPWL